MQVIIRLEGFPRCCRYFPLIPPNQKKTGCQDEIYRRDCLEIFCGQFLVGDGVKELDRLVTAMAGGPNTLVPARNIEGRGDILT